LKALRNIGAIRTVYRSGVRRDYFEAECQLRKLVSGFLRDQVNPHLENGKDRLDNMLAIIEDVDEEQREFLRERVEQLGKWRQRADRIMPLAIRMIEN